MSKSPGKSPRRIRLITLENFAEDRETCTINSPRSLQAIASLGLEPDDLLKKNLSTLRKHGEPDEYADHRFKFFESRRQEDLRNALQARERLIAEDQAQPKSRGLDSGNDDAANALTTDLLEKQRKLERIQQGYYKNMRQMLEHGVARHLSYQKATQKLEEAAERDAKRKAEEARLLKEKAENKRKANEARRARQEQLEEEARRQALITYHENIEKATRAKAEADKAAKEAQKDFIESVKKTEAKKQELENIRRMQTEQIQERVRRKEAREVERQRKLERQRQIKKMRDDEKKRALRMRIAQQQSDLKRIEEEKKRVCIYIYI